MNFNRMIEDTGMPRKKTIAKIFDFFFEFFSKFSWKSVTKNRFRSSFERSGTSGKSRATRHQNSSLLRRLATTKTSKKRFGKKLFFLISVFHVFVASKHRTQGWNFDNAQISSSLTFRFMHAEGQRSQKIKQKLPISWSLVVWQNIVGRHDGTSS